MSNIKLAQPLTKDEVRAIIRQRCPDLDLGTMGAMLTAYQSAHVAAIIAVNKKVLSVMPGVSSLRHFLVMFLICITGIGLIPYAAFIVSKQMKVYKRVKAALQEHVQELEAGSAQAAAAGR
jgi:hypothetical protein